MHAGSYDLGNGPAVSATSGPGQRRLDVITERWLTSARAIAGDYASAQFVAARMLTLPAYHWLLAV